MTARGTFVLEWSFQVKGADNWAVPTIDPLQTGRVLIRQTMTLHVSRNEKMLIEGIRDKELRGFAGPSVDDVISGRVLNLTGEVTFDIPDAANDEVIEPGTQ